MFSQIILNVVGPIIVIIGIGAFLRRKFSIDVGTMAKLNIYFAVPAFIFYTVATSKLQFSDMGGIVAITVLQVATLAILIFGIGKLLRIEYKTLAAIALAVMFYNSANYGLPLAELAYPKNTAKDGGSVQAFVLMTQNLLTFTVGLSIAASAHSGFAWTVVNRVAKLPMIPALVCGLLCKFWIASAPEGIHRELPIIIAKPAQYIAGSLVPLALCTLGAQLASNPQWPRWKPVTAVLILRLIFGPIQMALLLWCLHLVGWRSLDLWDDRGWPAELMILTAAVPTAVNTLLMTLELDGDAKLAADCVFWTTICSCFTIPMWLFILWNHFGHV